LEAARELNYFPNAAAQSLVGRRARTIALVLARGPGHIGSDLFLSQVLDKLTQAAKERGFRLILDVVPDLEDSAAYLALVRSRAIDGILLSGPRFNDQALEGLRQQGFPTVLMGQLPGSDVPSVDIDNRAAAKRAVSYLASLGYKRIGCITNAPLSFTAAEQRLEGYRQALAEAHLTADPSLVREADFTPESGHAQMASLLALPQLPDAVFVASDAVALGAMAAIREGGLRVPDDIAVMGFDDVPFSRYTNPPLTTVHLPVEELAGQACSLLLDLIVGIQRPQPQIVLDAELVIRDSCRPSLTASASLYAVQNSFFAIKGGDA
jgi:LacI family transcriptional regulator